MTTSPNCSLIWDSFVIVKYTGLCDLVQMEEPNQTSYVSLYMSITLSVLGAFFNLWALMLLLLDYRSSPIKRNHSNSMRKTGKTVVSKGSHSGSRRTTMQVGLIIFCLFEVLYHSAYSSGESLSLYVNIQIDNKNLPKPSANGSLTYIFSVLPLLQSLANWIRDTGICGRNWAITLITIARAEAVIWPLGSRCYQRFLREKRYFLLVFVLFAFTGLIISGLRRCDQKLNVCYSKNLESYCTSSEVLLISDLKQFSAIYFSFQTLLPWLLILIFTTLIIFQLKPCKKQAENSILRPKNKSGGRDNNLRASIAVTVIAVFCTIFEFPTFAVCMYYIAGNPHVSLDIWDTLANTLLQIDSIANFFLLIITMPSLRRRLQRTLPMKRPPEEHSIQEPRTLIVDDEFESKERS
nr:rhodopsin orphan GPCR [Hymenolepis microstoma]